MTFPVDFLQLHLDSSFQLDLDSIWIHSIWIVIANWPETILKFNTVCSKHARFPASVLNIENMIIYGLTYDGRLWNIIFKWGELQKRRGALSQRCVACLIIRSLTAKAVHWLPVENRNRAPVKLRSGKWHGGGASVHRTVGMRALRVEKASHQRQIKTRTTASVVWMVVTYFISCV